MGLSVIREGKSIDEEEFKQAVTTMESATNFVGDTIDDIKQVIKLEERAIELNMKPFRLSSPLVKATSSIRDKADEKGIVISVRGRLSLESGLSVLG